MGKSNRVARFPSEISESILLKLCVHDSYGISLSHLFISFLFSIFCLYFAVLMKNISYREFKIVLFLSFNMKKKSSEYGNKFLIFCNLTCLQSMCYYSMLSKHGPEEALSTNSKVIKQDPLITNFSTAYDNLRY